MPIHSLPGKSKMLPDREERNRRGEVCGERGVEEEEENEREKRGGWARSEIKTFGTGQDQRQRMGGCKWVGLRQVRVSQGLGEKLHATGTSQKREKAGSELKLSKKPMWRKLSRRARPLGGRGRQTHADSPTISTSERLTGPRTLGVEL
jgi:hypothetical protein